MSSYRSEYCVKIRTGDFEGAGTNAHVYITLCDKNGHSTKWIRLDNFFKNDFEKGDLNTFDIETKYTDQLEGGLERIKLRVDKLWVGSAWYVEKIEVTNRTTHDNYIFPVFRWIHPHFVDEIQHLDTSLPQNDKSPEQRKQKLDHMREIYKLSDYTTIAVQVEELPAQEMFSSHHKLNLGQLFVKLKVASFVTDLKHDNWETLDDLKNLYTSEVFHLPECHDCWREDWHFGNQRLCGVSPTLISLCKSIPNKLAVDEEKLTPFLEGRTLQSAMEENKVFIIDLDILHGIPCDSVVPSPIALFYVNKKNQLVPIAIQLFQESGPLNPVFLPSDPPFTWQIVKMWYNLAESSYHQALAHLGYTHLIMGCVALATYTNLSQSHPINKMLCPHFLYLIAINTLAVESLIGPGGTVDEIMFIGAVGVNDLLRKGMSQWRMDIEGTLPKDLKARGLLDPSVLPGYHYRDDGLLLYNAIQKYVTDYVHLYYKSEAAVKEDYELQNWAQALVRKRSEKGMEIMGVPGNGKFTNRDDLVETLTSCIFTCSVQHAAVNFPQYDTYGFQPNYPGLLKGKPPQSKKPLNETDLLACLPDESIMLSTMSVTKLLSERSTKSLGDFEIQYVFDPEAKKIVDRFRTDIEHAGQIIKERIAERPAPKYDYLDPSVIPNSISI